MVKFDFIIGQPNLCLIFNSKKMKRIILVSLYILASIVMNSCSTDDLENNTHNEKLKVTADADAEGNQNGQTPIPKPK